MAFRKKTVFNILTGILPILCIFMCEGKSGPRSISREMVVPQCTPRVIRIIPHEGAPFTQGLCFEGGILYESTGLYGESTIRTLDTNGMILVKRDMAENMFAEGCALINKRIFQITWREQRCFVYSASALEVIDSLPYDGEGWGLCATSGFTFSMSNGTDTLFARNDRFQLTGKIPVTCGGKPLPNLNELEYAHGRIYANVWYSDFIFEIDPQQGTVERIVDCGDIVRQEHPPSPESVLNGIAFRQDNGLFYLTGKNWKNIYLVEISPP